MEAKVTWEGRMSFTGIADSGIAIPLDTSRQAGGDDKGLRPMELLAIGLAGCTGMDVISILKKKSVDVTALEVKAVAERANDHPRIFTHIALEFIVTGHNIDLISVERAVELSANKYCSAQAILAKSAHIEHKITILEG